MKALQRKMRKSKDGEMIYASGKAIAERFLSRRPRAKCISVFLVVFAILAGIPSLSIAGKEKLSWDGKYLQENGAQDLYLEQYNNLLSVDIVKAGQSKHSLADGSHFVARITGNVAIFDDHQGCKTQLIRRSDVVEIKDDCSRSQRDSGPYKKAP